MNLMKKCQHNNAQNIPSITSKDSKNKSSNRIKARASSISNPSINALTKSAAF